MGSLTGEMGTYRRQGQDRRFQRVVLLLLRKHVE
jgi:hypothetical protein